MQTIKEFYISTYPADELGNEIDEKATFTKLLHILDTTNGDIYQYIGVADSLIRERIFEKLAEIIGGVNYDFIYSKWINNSKI